MPVSLQPGVVDPENVNEFASTKIIGVRAALRALEDASFVPSKQIFQEFQLDGQVAVVSGAYGGLGLEMALSLAEQGAKVYGFDLAPEPSVDFKAAAAMAKRLGTSMTYISCDVTQQERLSDLIQDIGEKEGGIHVCVAAAGIIGPPNGCPTQDYPADNFRKVIDVNCTGVFLTMQACAKVMVEKKCKGSLIAIASMSGSITNRGMQQTAYNTSKSAVLQMCRSMACELGQYGIRCNSISPGHITTNQTLPLLAAKPELGRAWADANPLGRLGEIHELRGVVAWLSSSASTFATGSDILVSGGHHAW